MRFKVVAIGAAIGAFAVAVPAAAHPSHSNQGKGNGHSHKCRTHNVAYIAYGVVDSSQSMTPFTQSGRRYSGTLIVDVRRTNHNGRADKGKTVTYTLTDVRVVFAHGTSNPPAAGDRVKVIGKIAVAAKKCTTTTGTAPGTITVRQVVVHTPNKK